MADVPIIGQPRRAPISSSVTSDLGPQIRLLICFVCKSIEELPDFEGHPDDDVLLEISVERHQDAAGVRHLGHLMKVPIKYWSRPAVRTEIIKQIREGSGGIDEVEKGFYDAKSTFHEDAMACFRQHNRPKGRCPDWKHDSKKLVPATSAERKEAGLVAPSKSPVHTYLCQFCPASVYMLTKAREEKGMYE